MKYKVIYPAGGGHKATTIFYLLAHKVDIESTNIPSFQDHSLRRIPLTSLLMINKLFRESRIAQEKYTRQSD